MARFLLPVPFGLAAEFTRAHHRHLPYAPNGRAHKFSVGLFDGVQLVGVVMVCRPVARHLDDGCTLEVSRLCTDGTRNACSRLYAAALREARRRGYSRLVTYTLAREDGASLRAVGWRRVAARRARSWNMPGRPRRDKARPEARVLWEAP